MEIIAWLSMALLSFALGGWMRDSAWRDNAGAPMRMCVKGQFYKVVRLNDEHSGDMLSIHGSEILVQGGHEYGDSAPRAWVLRKQADALEAAAELIDDANSRLELVHRIDRLRTQAEEIERGYV